MKSLVQFFADRSLIVNILSAGLLVAGIIFIVSAQREAFPRVEFDWVIVNTIYPGSTAEDVEKHITIEIENQVREVDGIDEIVTDSLEGRSVVAIKLEPDLDNKDSVINDIKNAIDGVSDFPDDAEDPEVTELNTSQTPVLEIAIGRKDGVRNDRDEFELRRYAKMLEDRILEIDGVARVDRKGYRDREMRVEVKPGLLDYYHVAINEVVNALSSKNLNMPGGVVKSTGGEVLIRTMGEVDTPRELEKVLIRSNDIGNWVRVGNVATVRDSFEDENIINKSRGVKSINLTILKKESADIIDLVDAVMAESERFRKTLGPDYEMNFFNDLSYFVKRRLRVLVGNGIIGFTLVLMSLFLSLGWRISVVTALGIPFSFFATFIWMGYSGVTVNLMSMFGLIMVLGMIVDDAIVVSENIYRYIESGVPVKRAVIEGTSEVIIPVAGTILTTIAAFMPLMMMKGIMGKFVWALPAVVSIALIASWIESMFILPSHIHDMESRSGRYRDGGTHGGEGAFLRFFKKHYSRLLETAVRHRYIFIAGITVVFFGTILFASAKVKFILFPQGNIETLVIKAEAPMGTTVRDMNSRLQLIEKEVAMIPGTELDTFTTRAGIIQENPADPGTKMGSNYGIIMVYLTPWERRDRGALEILDGLRERCELHRKRFEKLEFSTVRSGPPVGKPVSVDIKGDDFTVLKKISAEVREYLSTVNGLKDIKDNFETGKEEYRIHLRDTVAAITGITVFDVAGTVRSCFEGAVATTIKKTDEEIDIRVTFPEAMRNRLDTLKKVKVANRSGSLIPLTAVADFTRTRGIALITRKDWKRCITVTADIDEKAKGVTSVTVNRDLQVKFAGVGERYPGYIMDFAGEFKDTQESMGDLLRSFIIAVLVIYIILVAIFRSLSHPVIIMGVIPLAAIGIIWTFYLHGLPLSFMAIMGLVGLTGVVVNDSIVMVDFIIRERERGLSAREATLAAGPLRLRPIFLTTITTFLGLVPTAYGIGGFDPFLKPMALSLSWGLLFGTFITLIGTPVLYNVFVDVRRLIFGREHEEHAPRISATAEEREKEMEEEICRELRDEIRQEVRQELEEEKRPVKKGRSATGKKG